MLTNSEKKTNLYSRGNRPTISGEVTPEIPLESLNLNWSERDLPERERTKHVHRLHPYLGKYIPQLVEVFLRKYFKEGQTVLDPFCGSGTTLAQAKELGINSIGYDISAFNVLLSRVKTADYDIAKMSYEIRDILGKLTRSLHSKGKTPRLWSANPIDIDFMDKADPYLRKWYAPRTLEELLTYRQLIETQDYEYKDLLKIILSRSARSARLTKHFDLDFPKKPQREPYWCKKHSRTCYPIAEAYKFLRRYSLDTIRRIKEFDSLKTGAKVEVIHADSANCLPPDVDGVITSPPYVGLIDYHEQHQYAYKLLNLKDCRELEIGAAGNGNGTNARKKYQMEISEVFRNICAALPSKGKIIVVANDKWDIYPEIGKQIGIETVGVVKRHVNRRTGRRSSEYYESVFVWQKP